MIVTDYKENEDGSADVKVNLTDEETASLIQFAFIELLRRSIEEAKKDET